MSPRAAWQLEGLGFERVYDYVPGKADWFANGLPREGRLASAPKIGEAARRDVPTCAPAENVGAVRERVWKAGWDRCVVINKERVVLGLLREKELSSDPKSPVEEAMRNGPATFRPNGPVGKMAKRMQDRGATAALVTTSGGHLVSLLYRKDVEQLAGARRNTRRQKPQIGCCSTINLAGQHKMNQYPGAIPPWNRAFGTRSRLTE